MARKRMIDPGFWTDGKLGKLTRDHRLLFMGLISNADDEGRLPGHPAMIRSIVFPYDDDITSKHVGTWLDDLEAAGGLDGPGVIMQYQAGGEQYILIRNFLKHQYIKKPTPSNLPAPPTQKQSTPLVPHEYPTGTPLVDPKRKEKNRIERNRNEEEEKDDHHDDDQHKVSILESMWGEGDKKLQAILEGVIKDEEDVYNRGPASNKKPPTHHREREIHPGSHHEISGVGWLDGQGRRFATA